MVELCNGIGDNYKIKQQNKSVVQVKSDTQSYSSPTRGLLWARRLFLWPPCYRVGQTASNSQEAQNVKTFQSARRQSVKTFQSNCINLFCDYPAKNAGKLFSRHNSKNCPKTFLLLKYLLNNQGPFKAIFYAKTFQSAMPTRLLGLCISPYPKYDLI